MSVIGFLSLVFKLHIQLYDDVAVKGFDEGSWPGRKFRRGRERGGEGAVRCHKVFLLPIFMLKDKRRFNVLKSELVNTST